MRDPLLIPEQEAGRLLGLRPSTLRNRRLAGVGAPHVKIGARYFYRLADLHGQEKHRPGGRPLKNGVPSYAAIHSRIRARFGPASGYRCCECEGQAAHWAYDGTCSQELVGWSKRTGQGLIYSEHLRHYRPLCRACHARETARRGSAWATELVQRLQG